MFKRLIYFLIIFLCFLILAYLPPALKNKAENTNKQKINNVAKKNKESTIKVEEIMPADILAQNINKPIDDLIAIIGEAEDVFEHNDGSQSLIFGDTEENYIQVETTSEHQVKSLFVLGEQLLNKEFKLGMNLSDISEKIILSDQIELAFEGERFELELTGNDLNTKPIVSFANDSYAMLHLDHDNGQLIGVSYFSTAALIEEKPYQQLENLPSKLPKKNHKNKQQLAYQMRQFEQIAKIISKRVGSGDGQLDVPLSNHAAELTKLFIKDPSQVFKEPNKLQAWQTSQQRQMTSAFDLLEEAELENFMNLKEVPKEVTTEINAIVVTPVMNVSLLLMALASGELGQQELAHMTNNQFGFSIANNVAVILYY